jgi:uncharacterized membrane protein
MEPFSINAFVMSIVFCTVMAIRAVRKQSLSMHGAIVGYICGIGIITSTVYRGYVFFYFYQVGSSCTKYNLHIKSQRDGTVLKNSNRGAVQVFCVSFIVTLLSLYYGIVFGIDEPILYSLYPQSTRIMCAIIAHHATGLGDTMASELGILVGSNNTNKNTSSSNAQHQNQTANTWFTTTYLITNPWQAVPPGTNGGITVMGCIWSCIGGTIIGILTILTDYFATNSPLVTQTLPQYALPVILYATIIGFIGSAIDSILGATCQATYYDRMTQKVYHANTHHRPSTAIHLVGHNILTNEQVNLVSTAITCIIGGWIIGPLIVP